MKRPPILGAVVSLGIASIILLAKINHYNVIEVNDDAQRTFLLQDFPQMQNRPTEAQTQDLYQAPWYLWIPIHPRNGCLTIFHRLKEIFGKDTTYDFDYIKSLKSGPVEDAGYEGLPQVGARYFPRDSLTLTLTTTIAFDKFQQ